MRKALWLALTLASAAWPQMGANPVNVIPVTPVGGFVVPSGTVLKVRVDEALSTNRNQSGDQFTGTIADPVIVNGQTVVPIGTHIKGHVAENLQAGIVKGWARLVLDLDSFEMSGHSFPMSLTSATCEAAHKDKDKQTPDPNAAAVSGNRVEADIKAETVLIFTLGSPVRI